MIGYHLIPTMKVYTAKVTRRGQTTIPAPLRKRHGIEEGSRVEFREHGRTLVLRPLGGIEDSVGILAGKTTVQRLNRLLDEMREDEE